MTSRAPCTGDHDLAPEAVHVVAVALRDKGRAVISICEQDGVMCVVTIVDPSPPAQINFAFYCSSGALDDAVWAAWTDRLMLAIDAALASMDSSPSGGPVVLH